MSKTNTNRTGTSGAVVIVIQAWIVCAIVALAMVTM
jgi:hypothetical protein